MTKDALVKEVKSYLIEIKKELGPDLFFQNIPDNFSRNLPDFLITYCGESLLLELKAKGTRPRAVKMNILTHLKLAGNMAEWADSIDKAKDMINILVFNVPKKTRENNHLH